jgi:hypothetical protein
MGAVPDPHRGRGRSRGRGRAAQPCMRSAEISHMGEQEGGEFGFDSLDAYQRSVAAAAGIISNSDAPHCLFQSTSPKASCDERCRSPTPLRNRSAFGDGMCCNGRGVHGTASRESGYVGQCAFTSAANRADAEQDVPLIVHVHGYVHDHVQIAICTRSTWGRYAGAQCPITAEARRSCARAHASSVSCALKLHNRARTSGS